MASASSFGRPRVRCRRSEWNRILQRMIESSATGPAIRCKRREFGKKKPGVAPGPGNLRLI